MYPQIIPFPVICCVIYTQNILLPDDRKHKSTDVYICDSYLTCIHLIKILTEYIKVSAVFLKCSVKERKFSDDYIQLDFHFQEISIFF